HMTSASSICSERVLDVSRIPHVEDLMAISDILVTDYSSILFDFAISGRPRIQHIPDIVDYGKERGLYPSFAEQSDITTRTRVELSNAIKTLQNTGNKYANKPDLDANSRCVRTLLGYIDDAPINPEGNE